MREKNLKGFSKMLDKGLISRSNANINGNTNVKRHFVIMEKLGSSLRDFYDEIRLTLRLKDIIKIGIALIDQVKALHELGLLHCDIKPDNVMLAYYQGHMIDSIIEDEPKNNQRDIVNNNH